VQEKLRTARLEAAKFDEFHVLRASPQEIAASQELGPA